MISPDLKKVFKVGIIGCGSIGLKRAKALGASGKLLSCFDIDERRATCFAKENACEVSASVDAMLCKADLDIVIISTLHDSLAELAQKAIKAGKHILIEKPAGRNAGEIKTLIPLAKKNGIKVRVGLNHRFHPAILKAKELVDASEIGELMFIRGRYGHGGRVGYDKEWRSDWNLSGGGELIDQGPHMIDLCSWFLGDLKLEYGLAKTFFWDMEVDDNAFLVLKDDRDRVAQIHVSCTEWKNLFSLEIYGKLGKLDLFGLGGSYGTERLTYYKMSAEMGPPETTAWEFPRNDQSFATEINCLYDDIMMNRVPEPGLEEAYKVLKIIDQVYAREA